MSDLYAKLLYRVFNLKHWTPREILNLEPIKNAADFLNINYHGTHNFEGAYKNKHNLINNTQYIHITGTNGKGSVTKKIDKTLQLAGIKSGRFTSPHISSVIERITINDIPINKNYIEQRLQEILDFKDEGKYDLSFFDTLTILMLDYFQKEKVEIGVIEVGCGGQYDSTNFINPLLSIVTSIGLDHMHVLGNTKREIATNKSGIFKRNTPALIGFDTEPKDVFINKANELNCPIHIIQRDDYKSFEEENQTVAKEALLLLRREYDNFIFKGRLTDEIIEQGIKHKQSCRFEDVKQSIGIEGILKYNNKIKNMLIEDRLKVILDVGHNDHALNKVFETIKEEYSDYYIRIICGFSANKDISKMMKIIISNANKIYFASAEHSRLFVKEDYEQIIDDIREQYCLSNKNNFNLNQDDILSKQNIGMVDTMISKAISEVNPENKKELIIIIGSFFIMKDARQALGFNDYCDPFVVQEKPIVL